MKEPEAQKLYGDLRDELGDLEGQGFNPEVSADLFRRVADVLGKAQAEPDAEQLPKEITLPAKLAAVPEVRRKLEEAGVKIVVLSRKDLRARRAVAKRANKGRPMHTPLVYADAAQGLRRKARNKRKARKRKAG